MKKLMLSVLLAGGITLPSLSQADVKVKNYIFNLGSFHTSQDQKVNGKKMHYNQFNPGVGAMFDWNGDLYEIGHYYNSHKEHTLYAFKDFQFNDWIGASAGLATGYNESVIPLATLNFGGDNFKVKTTIAPNVRGDFSSGVQAIIATQYHFNF